MTTLELPARFRDLNRNSISVAEYHALGEDGTLTADDKVELIRGQVVPKKVKNPPHTRTLNRLINLFPGILPSLWMIGSESPVALADSEPEPDFSLVRRPSPGSDDAHITPGECGLIVEVSDSSLRYDRTTKREIYAEARIVHYWIVNLPDRQIEVYADPTETGEYAEAKAYRDGERVPVVLDGREVGALAVSEILPAVPK